MDVHLSLAYLEAEANALDLEAARIEQALKQKGPTEAEAQACIHRAKQRLRAMQDIDAHTIGAVIREHVASTASTPLAAGWQALQEARGDRRRLEKDLENGSDCRKDLQAYARHLHHAAAVEREQVAPWARELLGDVLLREADARLRSYGRAEPEIQVDWGRLAA